MTTSMLEPRRLAARAAAERLASELGEKVGETVGYRIRLDSKVGPNTRIEVVTEGILTRRLQDDPAMDGVGGEAAGFEHQDGLPGQPRLIQQRQRHAGGFTGAGRCFQHRFMAIRQGVTQGG